MAVAIRIKRGTKANIESAKATLKQWEQVYATDTDEIGIYDGTNIRWQSSGGGGGGEIDLNEMSYFDYAGSIYGAKYSLLASAWEHSLTVDPLEISEDSAFLNYRGKAQYPNGETEGVIIPHGVTSIGNNAFRDWGANNQPLIIPNSVTSIGSNAFSYWIANNQPLVIPDSVTSIGSYAFGYWQKNKHPLVIPESVTSIGINAFCFWVLVPYIEIQAITPPTLANINAFSNQNKAPIYVPNESVDDYKIANKWVDLADRIFPISDKDNTYTKGEIDLMIGDIENALDAILGV